MEHEPTHRTLRTATGDKVHAGVKLTNGWYSHTMCGTAITYRLTIGTEGTAEETANLVTCKNCSERLAMVIARRPLGGAR